MPLSTSQLSLFASIIASHQIQVLQDKSSIWQPVGKQKQTWICLAEDTFICLCEYSNIIQFTSSKCSQKGRNNNNHSTKEQTTTETTWSTRTWSQNKIRPYWYPWKKAAIQDILNCWLRNQSVAKRRLLMSTIPTESDTQQARKVKLSAGMHNWRNIEIYRCLWRSFVVWTHFFIRKL